MKINILYDFQDGATGGANQFLKGYRNYLLAKNSYEYDYKTSDAVVVNCSPQSLLKIVPVLCWNILIKKKVVVARIDGPIFLIRGRDFWADQLFFRFCIYLADLVIFQTNWSKHKCVQLGLQLGSIPSETIINTADPSIFYLDPTTMWQGADTVKFKCVISSWSDNFNKGFEFYSWLDEHCDFSKYDIHFIGNSPIKFQNIKMHPPMCSQKLADFYRGSHMYITASKNDPCSNSLIEALACGLPALALEDGGHPEIVEGRGILFKTVQEMNDGMDEIRLNYPEYRKRLTQGHLNNAFERYTFEIENILRVNKIRKKSLLIFFAFYLYSLSMWRVSIVMRKMKSIIQ
jgi:hypothetical protein